MMKMMKNDAAASNRISLHDFKHSNLSRISISIRLNFH